jgi:hypothetical protein
VVAKKNVLCAGIMGSMALSSRCIKSQWTCAYARLASRRFGPHCPRSGTFVTLVPAHTKAGVLWNRCSPPSSMAGLDKYRVVVGQPDPNSWCGDDGQPQND